MAFQDFPQIPVGLVGATGYTGMELLRLLAMHPAFSLEAVTSRKEAGRLLGDVHPFLVRSPMAGLKISSVDLEILARKCQLVFLAVPHGTAQPLAAELLALGAKVVDLSADFRLKDGNVYEKWYNTPHNYPDLAAKAVYGLPELYFAAITRADLLANPGCYPTSVILALAPALKHGLISSEDIIADSKSGVSGAGRKALLDLSFAEVHDSFKPYNLGGKHRHIPEMEQELSLLASTEIKLVFSPHLLPIDRGILSTIYARLVQDPSVGEILSIYADFYQDFPWVRILPEGSLPQTRFVRGTMYCDIGIVTDQRTGKVIFTSAIDNLCRGASGQALACANLMLELPLYTGLNMPSFMP